MDASAVKVIRQLQYKSVVEACEKLGHRLNDFPAALFGFSNTTCMHCDLGITVQAMMEKTRDGQINYKMRAAGPMLVQQCVIAGGEDAKTKSQ